MYQAQLSRAQVRKLNIVAAIFGIMIAVDFVFFILPQGMIFTGDCPLVFADSWAVVCLCIVKLITNRYCHHSCYYFWGVTDGLYAGTAIGSIMLMIRVVQKLWWQGFRTIGDLIEIFGGLSLIVLLIPMVIASMIAIDTARRFIHDYRAWRLYRRSHDTETGETTSFSAFCHID